MRRTLFLILLGLARLDLAPAAQPNLLVFLADDQGWGDLSLHSNTNLQTPHIDALARAGAAFERFFVCPVCAPTRAEFFTGRYHSKGGVRGVSTGQERLNADEKTIGDVFKAGGYITGAFGKWHNGSQWPYHPNARGFEEYYGFTSGHWGEYFDPPLEHNGRFVRGRGFISDDLADHAMAFMEKNKDRPFFCYIPFNTPHSPFCAPPEFWDRFKDKPILMRGKEGPNETIDVTRAALAMVENLDWNVGRVLAKLHELGLEENTIVVYFSDNGPNSFRWNGGMKGRKGTTDEGGVRSPLFIRWPGRIKPGTFIGQIAGAIDLLPTLASLAEVPLVSAKPLDGRDLSPLLWDPRTEWPDRMIFSHQSGRVSVRTQQYRLDDRGVLFDMSGDPEQRRAVNQEKPLVAARLMKAVADWRVEALAPLGPQDDRPFPVGYPIFPMTPLPARDGIPHGGVKRSAPAPNCSYFVNWTRTSDSMTWDIEVHTEGDYEAILYYACADPGSIIELRFGEAHLTGKVSPAWNPPLITNQDVIPRPAAESIMKEFLPLPLGTIHLKKGRGPLTLHALEIPGATVMDLRLLTLTLRQ